MGTPEVCPLSAEVDRRVELFWPDAEDRRRMREALLTYGVESYEREENRVRLAILKLSNGDLEKALGAVGAAKLDYRDVLLEAEFPKEARTSLALRSSLTPADQERLTKIRKADREDYVEWLRKTEK